MSKVYRKIWIISLKKFNGHLPPPPNVGYGYILKKERLAK